jgi:hypothetical protein
MTKQYKQIKAEIARFAHKFGADLASKMALRSMAPGIRSTSGPERHGFGESITLSSSLPTRSQFPSSLKLKTFGDYPVLSRKKYSCTVLDHNPDMTYSHSRLQVGPGDGYE